MATVTETVKVILENVVIGIDRLKEENKIMQSFAKNLGLTEKQMGLNKKQLVSATKSIIRNQRFMVGMREQYDSFGGSLRMGQENWSKFNKVGGKFNTLGARVGNSVRKMTHGLKGFRMEMLGVMFFGMGMTRLFKGMLRPAAELTGMFDLWRVTMQILFLPIMLAILPLFITFVTWIINLSERTKKMIGIFVIIGFVLGLFLTVVGTLALGIGSIILVFGGAIASLITLGVNIIKVGSIIGGKVGAWITGFFLFLGTIKGVGAASEFLSGVWEKINASFVKSTIINSILEKMGIQIDEGSTFVDTFKQIISDSFDSIAEKLGFGEDAWEDLKTKVSGVIDDLLEKLGLTPSEISLQLGIWRLKFLLFKKNLEDDFDGMKEKIDEFIKEFEKIADQIELDLPTFVELANTFLKIADSLVKMYNAAKKAYDIMSRPGNWLRGVTGGLTDTFSRAGVPGVPSGGMMNDFLMRPGQSPVPFSPNDTIIGSKGGLGGGGSGVNINQTINVTASNKDEISRLIDDNNKKLVDDVRRMSNITGG